MVEEGGPAQRVGIAILRRDSLGFLVIRMVWSGFPRARASSASPLLPPGRGSTGNAAPARPGSLPPPSGCF